MTAVPPHLLAHLDQGRTHSGAQLDKLIDGYRQAVAEAHDEPMTFSGTVTGLCCWDVAGLACVLAEAVSRLAGPGPHAGECL